MSIFEKISMQRGVEQNPPKDTGGFYSTPLLEGRGGGRECIYQCTYHSHPPVWNACNSPSMRKDKIRCEMKWHKIIHG
jgi:hypothetical protein